MYKNKAGSKIKIDCKTCEKLIPLYLESILPMEDMGVVISHIKNCSSCKEELTIQYFVTEGLQQVEESDNYDLISELKIKLASSEKAYKRYKNMRKAAVAFLIVLFIIVIISVILLIY